MIDPIMELSAQFERQHSAGAKLTYGGSQDPARAFMDLRASGAGRSVFDKYGF